MNCRNFILSTIVAAAGMASVSGHALTLRECSLEATPAAPSEIVSERSGQTYLTLSADGKNVVRCDYKTGRQEAVVMSTARPQRLRRQVVGRLHLVAK